MTRTAIWELERRAALPAGMIMSTQDMVDITLRDFDMGKTVTIPSLPDVATWYAYLAARDAFRPGLWLAAPAAH